MFRAPGVKIRRHQGVKHSSIDVFEGTDKKEVRGRFDIDGSKVVARVAGIWWDVVIASRTRQASPDVPAPTSKEEMSKTRTPVFRQVSARPQSTHNLSHGISP